jgi:predicted nuclease with TOPRIM domain
MNHNGKEDSTIELIEHLACRIEGFQMDLHRRIDWLDNEVTDLRNKLEELLEEVEEIIEGRGRDE